MLSALREAESRFRVIADSVPVLIWMGDSGGGRSFFNKTWLDFTGRNVDAESGWGWLSSVHPEDRSSLIETFRQALAARQEYLVEYRMRRGEGDYCWMVEKGVPRTTARGTFTGFIGSTTDITGRKEAELATAQACARVEAEAETRLSKVRQLADKLERIRARLEAGGVEGDLQPVMERLVAEIDEALDLVSACLPEREAVPSC
jgi:PAS domain S-box-containing protein